MQTVRILSSDIGMEFAIFKCAMLEMKRSEVMKSERLELTNGETMKSLED